MFFFFDKESLLNGWTGSKIQRRLLGFIALSSFLGNLRIGQTKKKTRIYKSIAKLTLFFHGRFVDRPLMKFSPFRIYLNKRGNSELANLLFLVLSKLSVAL